MKSEGGFVAGHHPDGDAVRPVHWQYPINQ